MAVSPFRHTEPPSNLPAIRKEEGIATLGRVLFRNRNDMFGIRSDDRFRHIAILGKTGMGKSTLLESLIAADIKAGQGVALLDPHGDLAEQILTWVPRVRTNDICYFDAGDQAFPIAFNPLACRNVPERPLVASGIVSAFKKIYGDSWGPRLEYILRNALLALVDTPDSSLSCPSISWVGDARTTSFPYGAHHISEGLAQLHEGLERCFDSQREHEYLALPFKVIDFVGKNRFAHMQKHAFVTYQVIADRRHRDACRIRLDDFMAFGQIKHATEKGSAVAAFFRSYANDITPRLRNSLLLPGN